MGCFGKKPRALASSAVAGQAGGCSLPCRRVLLWVVLLAMTMLVSGCNYATPRGIAVEAVNFQTEGDSILVRPIIKLDPAAVVLEALDNGVPLTFVVRARIERKWGWWHRRLAWDREILQMRYRPLAEQYVNHEVDGDGQLTGQQQVFPRRRHAIAALGQNAELTLPNPWRSGECGDDCVITVGAYLDLAALPAPVRLPAYFSRRWRVHSGFREFSAP